MANAGRKECQIALRPPKDLVKKIDAAARKAGRSRNKEAIHRLERSFDEAESSRVSSPVAR